MNAPNVIAEVVDTFFNERPAPKRVPAVISVKLTRRHLDMLKRGCMLAFRAGETQVLVTVTDPERQPR
jgi:hypothetical protein